MSPKIVDSNKKLIEGSKDTAKFLKRVTLGIYCKEYCSSLLSMLVYSTLF